MSTSAAIASLARREPSASPPAADVVANPARVDSKRQHALRADRRPDLLVVHERRRAAELAVLADPRRIEHHDRTTGLALDAAPLGLPAALLVGQLAQRLDQIELDDLARARDRSGTATRSRRTGTPASAWPGFHSACAPHAGHSCFSSAVTWRSSVIQNAKCKMQTMLSAAFGLALRTYLNASRLHCILHSNQDQDM